MRENTSARISKTAAAVLSKNNGATSFVAPLPDDAKDITD
jgi:hypothetical protein